jgi:hypothetical protein
LVEEYGRLQKVANFSVARHSGGFKMAYPVPTANASLELGGRGENPED